MKEENSDGNVNSEPLGQHQARMAEPILPLLGEDICKRAFSRS